MGEVFSVLDTDLRRRVAKKVLRSGSHGGALAADLARFMREARITGGLEHPNIVPVHQLGVDAGGRAYFTMKLVTGRPLDQLMRSGAAPLHDLLRILVKACDGVAFAHEHGVVHRDLKPANVMVGEHGEVLVMDWGLARILHSEDERASPASAPNGRLDDARATTDGAVIGTPAYMAPEQARGETDRISERTDMHALGAMLYEMVTGCRAYEGRDSVEVLDSVRAGRVSWPCERFPGKGISREIDAIVRRAMAFEPADRHPDVRSFSADLQAFLEDRLVAAAQYHPAQVAWKWVRRNRAISAVAAAAAGVLAALAVLFVTNLAVERTRAVQASDQARAAQRAETAQRRSAEDALAWSRFVEARALADAGRSRESALILEKLEESAPPGSVPRTAIATSRWQLARSGLDVELSRFSAGGPVRAVAVEADGRHGLVPGDDGAIRRIDLATGAQVGELHGHAGPVNALAISRDGRLLASAGEDGTVRTWDLPAGAPRRAWSTPQPARALSLSPDGRRLAALFGLHEIVAWDLVTGREWTVHGRTLLSLAFLQDSRRLAVATHPPPPDAPHVDLWDVTAGRRLGSVGEHEDAILFVAATPDGRSLVTGSEDKTLALWDLRPGRRERTFEGHGFGVKCGSISRDGRLLFSGSFDQTVRAWDLGTGRQVAMLSGHADSVTALAVSPEAGVVLSGSADATARAWPVGARPEWRRWPAHAGLARALTVSDDGRLALTGGEDHALRLWDLRSGRLLWERHVGGAPLSVALEGSRAVSCVDAADTWALRRDDVPAGAEDARVVLPLAPTSQRHAGVAPDGRFAWFWSPISGGALCFAPRGREPVRLPTAGAEVTACHLADDGGEAATCLLSVPTLRRWNLGTGKGVDTALDLPAIPSSDYRGAFSADGRLLLLADSQASDAALVDAVTVRTVHAFAGIRGVLCFDVSPDGRGGLLGKASGEVVLLDLASGRELRRFQTREADVLAVRFLPDGESFVSLGASGSLAVWDVSAVSQLHVTREQVEAAQAALALDPDDAASLKAIGERLALAGRHDWALDLLTRAESGGARVPPETLARCEWAAGDQGRAASLFARAAQEATTDSDRSSLRLCAEAAAAQK